MDHSDASQALLEWFIVEYPGWYIFQNNTGFASMERVKYGIPNTGGGFDYLCIGDDAKIMWVEVKTDGYPTLSVKQKRFAKKMTAKKVPCYVWRMRDAIHEFVDWEEYKP